jgi:Carboxypeptidase regulatory-like domain
MQHITLGGAVKRIFQKQFSMAVLSVLLSSCAMQVTAQSTARLQGTVNDPTGAVIAGATIEIQNLETNLGRKVVSDAAGNYSIPSLPPGPYKLEATATGFNKYVLNNTTLLVDQTSTINIQLEISSTGEVIQVDASTPLINSQTVTVGQVINQRTVQNIPLNGRHFLDLTQLVPGSVTAPSTGNLTSPSRGLGANSFITAGNREDSANIMINGVNLNDQSQNQITFQPSINTTSEFKISNSTYGAEYGRSSGSIVNIATRSGTNKIHGEIFDYLRNNDLDARNYFNPTGKPMNTLQRNNFGGAIGGPILKDRTFYFLSYEGLRQAQQINLTSGVLTSAQRQQLAASTIPNYSNIVNLIPVANDSTGANFVGSATGPVSINQYTADLSHLISATDQLHLYYAFQQDNRTEPNLQGNTVPGFGDHRDSHRQIGTINETHIFSSNLVNEARLGFDRIAIAFSPEVVLKPGDYGISTGVTGGEGFPQISVTGLGLNFGGPSTFPQGRFDTGGVLSDTLSYLHGKHSIKAGGEYRRVVGDSFNADPGTLTFSSAANFVAGVVNNFTITPSQYTSRVFVNALGGFVADTYQLNKNLTLELGFRFEWNGTPTEGANRFVNFLASSDSLVQINTNGYNNVYNQNYNYEPRVGFSWDVRGNQRTVLHGGYGYLVDQPTLNLVTGLAANPPFASPVNFAAAAGAPPVLVNGVSAAAKASGLAPAAVNPKFSNAYTESYNLNLEQQVAKATVLQLGYIGSVGRHLRIRRNINQPTINGTNRPFARLSTSSPIAPGQAIGNIPEWDSDSFSDYNALWATVRQNLSHGLEFSSTYTWSKSMDVNSLGSQGALTLQDNFNPRGNYGLSDFDVRDRLVFSGIWSLPFHGNRLKSGWQLANITQLQTGNPMNITTSSTYNGSASPQTIRPNVVGTYSTHRTRLASNNVQYINALGCGGTIVPGCTFFAPTAGFGNLGRNALTGPGFADSDLSLQKETALAEGTTLQFRIDAFDFTNHPSFAPPSASNLNISTSGTTAATTFGQITATRFPVGDLGSSRQLQIALKLLF